MGDHRPMKSALRGGLKAYFLQKSPRKSLLTMFYGFTTNVNKAGDFTFCLSHFIFSEKNSCQVQC